MVFQVLWKLLGREIIQRDYYVSPNLIWKWWMLFRGWLVSSKYLLLFECDKWIAPPTCFKLLKFWNCFLGSQENQPIFSSIEISPHLSFTISIWISCSGENVDCKEWNEISVHPPVCCSFEYPKFIFFQGGLGTFSDTGGCKPPQIRVHLHPVLPICQMGIVYIKIYRYINLIVCPTSCWLSWWVS